MSETYTYQLTLPTAGQTAETAPIRRLPDNAFIPQDGGNRDFQAFLEWKAAGNTPDPAPPLPDTGPPPPDANARLDAGIEAALTSLDQPTPLRASTLDDTPVTRTELVTLQAQVDQLQLAVKEMLTAQYQAGLATPSPLPLPT